MTNPNTEADVEAVEEIFKQWFVAANSGDLDKFLTLLSTDFEVFPPSLPSMRGSQARQWLTDFFHQFTIDLRFLDEEIVVSGDMAFHRYSFEWTVSPKNGGDPIHERGAGITILQRQQDGAWKIIKDIWNNDAPPS